MERNMLMIAFPVAALTSASVLEAAITDANVGADELREAEAGPQSADMLGFLDDSEVVELDRTGQIILIQDSQARGLFDVLKKALKDQGFAFDEHDEGDDIQYDRMVRFWRPGLEQEMSVSKTVEEGEVVPARDVFRLLDGMRSGELNQAEALDMLSRMPSCIYRDMPLSQHL